MDTALTLLMLLATAGSGIVALEWQARQALARSWQTVRLHFGRDVTPEAVVAFLDAVAGLHRHASVVLDVRADHAGISHYLSSDRATLDTLRGSARALLPSLRLEPVEASADAPYRYGRTVRLRGRLKVLRSDGQSEMSAGLLSAAQPLGTTEHLLIRWVLQPDRPQRVPQPQDPNGRMLPSEHRRLLKLKNEGSVLRARGLVAVAAHPERARHLLGRVTSVLRTRSTSYGYLRSAPRSSGVLRRDLARRSSVFTDRYASGELAGLLAWPIDAPVLPGVNLGTSPLLMPSQRLPRTGRVFGVATWPGAERPIAQPVVGALSHSLIAGPTGVGKSTLLTNLVVSDIAAGRCREGQARPGAQAPDRGQPWPGSAGVRRFQGRACRAGSRTSQPPPPRADGAAAEACSALLPRRHLRRGTSG
jgi:hypothetical protein